MNLPGASDAWIPPEKLTRYLLCLTHPVGGPKAKFFRHYGFHEMNVHLLEEQLLLIARSEQVVEVAESPYGTKYSVDGTVRTPTQQVLTVRSIWIVEKGRNAPRFVTAFPA